MYSGDKSHCVEGRSANALVVMWWLQEQLKGHCDVAPTMNHIAPGLCCTQIGLSLSSLILESLVPNEVISDQKGCAFLRPHEE